MTSGKSPASTAIRKGILLVIVPRSNNDFASNASGSHALAPVAIDKLKSSQATNKYERSATTTPRNKEPKTGSPTSLTNKMMSKNSSCNRCWEQRDRIFKALEPDGLGESYSL